MSYRINHTPSVPQSVITDDYATITTTISWDEEDVPPSVTDALVFNVIADQPAEAGTIVPGNVSASFPYEVQMMQNSLNLEIRTAKFQSVFIAKTAGDIELSGAVGGDQNINSVYSFRIIDRE
ncbi:MAG: hypothetical protein LBE54_08380 [Brucellaceae bacterium]|jgi:hypothetical protein|nr:hypothetical protein [Brucellaceae bacterium]